MQRQQENDEWRQHAAAVLAQQRKEQQQQMEQRQLLQQRHDEERLASIGYYNNGSADFHDNLSSGMSREAEQIGTTYITKSEIGASRPLHFSLSSGGGGGDPPLPSNIADALAKFKRHVEGKTPPRGQWGWAQ
jgi:hypothetical protein